MWRPTSTCLGNSMALFTSPRAYWAANMQRRCKTSSSATGLRSHGNFRAGTVESTPFQVKPSTHAPVWQPSDKYMKYKPVRWLSSNLLPLATYQLTLEVGFTIIFGILLYAEKITAQGVSDWLAAYHYPFVNWIDVEGGVYTQPVRVGPFTLNAQKMTALHTGHNIANGLLPLQVLLLATTFAPAQYVYRLVRHRAPSTAAAATTVPPPPSSTGVRRASYARATGAKKPHRRRICDQFSP
ncbi:hypothetical protein LSCM1_04609 [Leishmania martiniquensis]|uniref:Uncharacterized protein n=1 Tax=Leishmania martiniquensis TaxID=1580590 RepID=A0A836HK03_9TRYP|nr:hypothetical protein LSCM1_04609 [Leishmania martiniquensis]